MNLLIDGSFDEYNSLRPALCKLELTYLHLFSTDQGSIMTQLTQLAHHPSWRDGHIVRWGLSYCHMRTIILSYEDYHIVIWGQSYCQMRTIMLSYEDNHIVIQLKAHRLYLLGWDSRLSSMIFWLIILVLWWPIVITIILSYDDHYVIKQST